MMRRIRKEIISFILCFHMMLIGIGTFYQPVYAQTTEINLVIDKVGKGIYQKDDELEVEVTISGAQRIGAYNVRLTYDTDRLVYVSGADSSNNKEVYLSGTGYGDKIKYVLKFKAKSNGVCWVKVSAASISKEGSNLGEQNITKELPTATMTIGSVDSQIRKDNLMKYGMDTDIKLVAKAGISNSAQQYIIDIKAYSDDDIPWDKKTIEKTFGSEKITFYSTMDEKNLFVYLMDEDYEVNLYAYSETKDQLYPCKAFVKDEEDCLMMSAYVCSEWPAGMDEAMIKDEKLVYVVDGSGVGRICKFVGNDEVEEWDTSKAGEEKKGLSKTELGILVIVIFIVLCVIIMIVGKVTRDLAIKRRRRKEREADLMYEEGQELLEFLEDE